MSLPLSSSTSFQNNLKQAIRQVTLKGNGRFNSILVGGFILSTSVFSTQAIAASIGFEVKTFNIDEPNSGSRVVNLTPIVTFDDNSDAWDDMTPCTITANISIANINITETSTAANATEGIDYNVLGARSFSLTTQPRREGESPVLIDTLRGEIPFEILDDGDEDESTEHIHFSIANQQVTCADGSSRPIDLGAGQGSYGSIIINDPFDEKPVEENNQGVTESPNVNAIPLHQKSLATQLNSLRTLALQAAETQNRGIAKEIHRARSGLSGINMSNLQVSVDGKSLPNGLLPGSGAGDPHSDFGRWGFFLSGSINTGDFSKNTNIQTEYDSSLLMAGIDYRLTSNIVIGSVLSRTVTDAGTREHAKTDFNRSSISLFGSYYFEDLYYVDAILSQSRNDYDLSRKITTNDIDNSGVAISNTAGSATDGDDSSLSIGTGYNFHSNHTNLRLFSLLTYIDVNIDEYEESVTNASLGQTAEQSSAAHLSDINLQSLTGDFGFEVSWSINTNLFVWSPALSLTWQHQFKDDAVDIKGNFIDGIDSGRFYFEGASRDKDYINAQFGVTAVFRNGFTGYISYDKYLKREDFDSKQYAIGARWQF